MKILFAHISWMPEYSGKASEPMFSTHGYVVENKDGGERSNFKSVDGYLYGYVPVLQKPQGGVPGRIVIEKIGAVKGDDFVDGIDVIWFANDPRDSNKAYIVGWYRNARVFRHSQNGYGPAGFRIRGKSAEATLLPENLRRFPIYRSQSTEGRELGFGYGTANIWYAEKASESFIKQVVNYIVSAESILSEKSSVQPSQFGDAIDDIGQPDIGHVNPKRGTHFATYVIRDDRVRRRVVERAQGRCEHCGELGFRRADGSHYVEAHHIISLAVQGPDTLDNVIALCPNHHREAHFGEDREQLETQFKVILAKLQGN